MQINEPCDLRLGARWKKIQVGGGSLSISSDGLRLATVGASRHHYADAQIDDYSGLRRVAYPWHSPLHMRVEARASGRLRGTAGFGFWNNPFSPFGGVPALPAAIWFFHASPPSDMPLAEGVAGHGWKAAIIDATTPRALRWAPLAPLIVVLNRHAKLRSRLWPRIQRDLAIAEAAIPALDTNWHQYEISWQRERIHLLIDGQHILAAPFASRGPLGFVAWVDNQYAIATPTARLGWGLLDVPAAQWIELRQLVIAPA